MSEKYEGDLKKCKNELWEICGKYEKKLNERLMKFNGN